MKGIFVCGTDTNVGKTVISSLLVAHAKMRFAEVIYHKPIQTGIISDDDAKTVQTLTGISDEKAQFGVAFTRPLSPHLAAYYENDTIDVATIVDKTKKSCQADFNIIEGAGGLLVPINRRYLMIDLIKKLDLPTVLVARSTLGTINHTLLSIEALKKRRIPLRAIIMVGPKNRDNVMSVKLYSGISQVIWVPWFSCVDKSAIEGWLVEHENVLDSLYPIEKAGNKNNPPHPHPRLHPTREREPSQLQHTNTPKRGPQLLPLPRAV